MRLAPLGCSPPATEQALDPDKGVAHNVKHVPATLRLRDSIKDPLHAIDAGFYTRDGCARRGDARDDTVAQCVARVAARGSAESWREVTTACGG